MFAGRYKATVVNGTKRSMLTRGTRWESVKLRESKPVIFNGVLKDGNENTANPTLLLLLITAHMELQFMKVVMKIGWKKM